MPLRKAGKQERSSVCDVSLSDEIADAHFAVVRSHFRASGGTHGLHFAKPTLEVKRVVAALDPFLPS